MLYVLYENQLVGNFSKDANFNYTFQYEKSWLEQNDKLPLSFHLPFRAEPFENKAALSFFENLLPEEKGRQNVLNSKDPINFFEIFGNECIGAFTLVPKELLDRDLNNESPSKEMRLYLNTNLRRLEISEFQHAIKSRVGLAKYFVDEIGNYFLMPGDRDKLPVVYRGGVFYLPNLENPSTHIIKAPTLKVGIRDRIYNELFCTRLAKKVGLNVPSCFLLDEEIPLLVSERFDRHILKNGYAKRVHQQDFCQALGFTSDQKLELKGGPSFKDNYDFVKKHISPKHRAAGLLSLMDWLAFNLLIGNNYSHSKNISLVESNDSNGNFIGFKVAPFYDLMSTKIYKYLKQDFAFKIGTTRQLSEISLRDVEEFENSLGIRHKVFLNRIKTIANLIEEKAELLSKELVEEYPRSRVSERINRWIVKNIQQLRARGIC